MKHTDEEIEAAARRFEEWAGSLDPDTAEVEDISDLREVADAADTARRDEARMAERVAIARAHGRSWNQIALALGVSRQAARQRFAASAEGRATAPGHRVSSAEIRRWAEHGSLTPTARADDEEARQSGHG